MKICRILFLSAKEPGLERIAESFAARHAVDSIVLGAAVLNPSGANPQLAGFFRDAGFDPAVSSRIDAVATQSWDVVIVLDDDGTIEADCPLLPGRPAVLHWRIPALSESRKDVAACKLAFAITRDTLQRLVNDFFEQGYLNALLGVRGSEGSILDSVSDGIVAHDLNRRIVFVNRAAEAITGVRREQALGQDCHAAFDGNLCGGHCAFCDPASITVPMERQYRMRIVTPNGDQRMVEAYAKPITNPDGHPLGMVLAFQDRTREDELARRIGDIQTFAGIIGRDEKMLALFDLVREVADAHVPVLIQGESGTGKELIAAAIHNESRRAHARFVTVNCGALPEGLLESELFGHVRGSFTGATRDKKGRFELADGGTVFLDEIGDISPAMQVRLLRVLQEGAFERVGSERTQHVDVRIVSATHRDLRREITNGRFREDLFYRLNVVPIWLPPLRDRRNDIPLLANHFVSYYASDMQRDPPRVTPEAMAHLLSYDWPGNVRELQNWLQFALVKCRGNPILPEHFPPISGGTLPEPASLNPRRMPQCGLTTATVREALRHANHSRVTAARQLGVSRATLYRFFKQYPDVLETD